MPIPRIARRSGCIGAMMLDDGMKPPLVIVLKIKDVAERLSVWLRKTIIAVKMIV